MYFSGMSNAGSNVHCLQFAAPSLDDNYIERFWLLFRATVPNVQLFQSYCQIPTLEMLLSANLSSQLEYESLYLIGVVEFRF